MAKAKAKSMSRGKKKGNILVAERGGFTIIEVVLVLAIAGLIFLMVFLALPAMQRAQRDQQRRSTLGNIQQAIQNYQTNNNGRLPSAGDTCQVIDQNDDGTVPLPEVSSSTGSTTNAACKFIVNYLNSANAKENEFVDPDGVGMGLSFKKYDAKAEVPALTYDHIAYVYFGALCGADEGTLKEGQPRDFAVLYKLEGSGTYCQD